MTLNWTKEFFLPNDAYSSLDTTEFYAEGVRTEITHAGDG